MEVWKTLIGYDLRYEVSNLGKVRSLDRIVIKGDGRWQKVVGRVLQAHCDGAGYLHVGLSKSTGVQKNVTIHRAVAEAFIPKIKDADYVDHIDGNKHNNAVSNLRWVTSGLNANNRHVSRSITGVVGVSYSPKANARNPYKVEIKMAGKSKFIGYFKTIDLAKSAREKALADEMSKLVH